MSLPEVAAIMDSASTLQQMLSTEPDIVLAFSTNDVKQTLKSHSSIIRLSSPVLANALELQPTCTSSTLRQLPLPGTSKADFLTVAQFLYPVVPLPRVSWDILEVLLVEGRKWDIQVVLARAAEFLQANASSLDLTQSSSKYAFKWLQLADAARLADASRACADHIVALDRSSCVSANLQGLSPPTLVYLLDRVATTSAPSGYLGSSSSAMYGAGAYFGAGQDIHGIGCGFTHFTFDECSGCARTRVVRARATYSRAGGVRIVRMCDDCAREP